MKHIYILLILIFSCQSTYSSQSWMNYTSAFIINDMAENNNFIWAASYGGLIRIDKSTQTSTIFTGANSGIKTNAIQLVAVDDNGKVWICYANPRGVSSFDGTTWNYYNSFPNGKSLGVTQSLKVDHLNRFWCQYSNSYSDSLGNILQDQGLAMFDNSSWTFFDSSMIPELWMTNDFDIDTLGNIWLSSAYGIIKYDGFNTTIYDTSNSILNAVMYSSIAVDKKNNVWVSTSDSYHPNLNRIYSFSNGLWTKYTDSLAMIAAKPNKIFIGKDNKKYFYNESGVYEYDDTVWSVVPDSEYQGLMVSALVVDTASHLWTCANDLSGSYIHEYDGTTLKGYQTSICPIKDDYGIGVEIDSAGNKWLLSESGLFKYDGVTFTDMTPFQTNHWPSFEDILIDKQQNVWVGCADQNNATNDLYMFDGNSWTSFPYQSVYDLELDSSGNVWFISSPSLLNKYDGTNFNSFNLSSFGLNISSISLTIDIFQRIWISGFGAILIFDGNSNWTVLNQFNSPINPQISITLKADKSGWVWIPDRNGCYKTDGTTWNYITAGWLKGGGVYNLLVDSLSQVWMATGICLTHYNGSSFINYTVDNCGIGSNNVRDIEVDKNGNAWLTSTYGGFAVWNESGIKELIDYPKCKIEGNVYLDDNFNGLFDTTEVKLPYQQTLLLPDSVFRLTNNSGAYYYFVDSGLYNVNFFPVSPWALSSDSASFTLNVQNGNYCCYDFGINSSQQMEQLEIDVAYGGLRCYNQQQIWLTAKNTGTQVINAIVYYVIDTTCALIFSQPTPTLISNDTLFWDLGPMTPFQISNFNVFIQVGDPFATIHFYAGIINASTGVQMDSFQSSDMISCSFDPNDKIVQPPGVNEQHYTLMSDSLTYTIRFQNTGNDTAFLVIIRDTLNDAFDFSTLEYVSSSHPCTISCTGKGAAEFRFDNILLPYKTLDEPHSSGFVKFRLKVKPGTLDYTLIRNKAYIQFDFNVSIITNTTENTMVNSIPIGINSPTVDWHCTLFPNPVSSLSNLIFTNDFHDKFLLVIYDLTGKRIEEYTSQSTSIPIHRNSYVPGIYLWKLMNLASGNSINGKMVVQ